MRIEYKRHQKIIHTSMVKLCKCKLIYIHTY